MLSIERHASCWKSECGKELSPLKCIPYYFDCSTLREADRMAWENSTHVFNNCNPESDGISFQYGIFENALTNAVVTSDFLEKYFYCLWWGLQNLRYVTSLHFIFDCLQLFQYVCNGCGKSQFLWSVIDDKHVCRRNLVCHSYCYIWSCAVCSFDRKYAGTDNSSVVHISGLFQVPDN